MIQSVSSLWPDSELFCIVPRSVLSVGHASSFTLCHTRFFSWAESKFFLNCATLGFFSWPGSRFFFYIVPRSVASVGVTASSFALCHIRFSRWAESTFLLHCALVVVLDFVQLVWCRDCFLHKLMTLGTRHLIQTW